MVGGGVKNCEEVNPFMYYYERRWEGGRRWK
jgi:hypothetical protein